MDRAATDEKDAKTRKAAYAAQALQKERADDAAAERHAKNNPEALGKRDAAMIFKRMAAKGKAKKEVLSKRTPTTKQNTATTTDAPQPPASFARSAAAFHAPAVASSVAEVRTTVDEW